MKNILCYGDSNTWGYMPGLKTRYESNIRWPGVVRELLGPDYNIYEEGISGRLTVLEDPYHKYWNGRDALRYALLSTYPLDLVILMLGTNDLKYVSAENAARGINVLVSDIKQATVKCDSFTPVFCEKPKVLIVSPPMLHSDIHRINPTSDLRAAYEESKKMSEEYWKVADANEVYFLDAAKYVKASEIDGIHLEETEHRVLGTVIADMVKEIIL